ncbi:hypothetical protein G9A89_010265 [Geosiphon pyriformis]|nr:hypothetical protein G9A89_010265 [Geosiphon pyriformis]
MSKEKGTPKKSTRKRKVHPTPKKKQPELNLPAFDSPTTFAKNVTAETDLSTQKSIIYRENDENSYKDSGDFSKSKMVYSINRLSGGFLCKYPVVFTSDTQFFFCCVANTIKIYSLTTGNCINTLSMSPNNGGHGEEVTSIVLHPTDSSLIYSASLDGTIKLWNYIESKLLKTFYLNTPIKGILIHPLCPKDVYALTDISSVDLTRVNLDDKSIEETLVKNPYLLVRIELNDVDEKCVLFIIQSSSLPFQKFDISLDGKYMVTASERQYTIINIQKVREEQREWPCYGHPQKITSIAISPTRRCVAIGDEVGQITYCYCLTEEHVKNPITSKVHWHAHKVNTLSFSRDGTYLLSGGEEAVLTIWQVETGQRRYVPRLGNEILTITISPNQHLYAIGLADNTIKVLSATNLTIRKVIQGLKHARTNATDTLSTGLVVEPRNQHVVLNGIPGTLQWYDPYNGVHVSEVEIMRRTFVSKTDTKEIIDPLVEHVAFSPDGKWMATVDSRDDGETTPEFYLKFWEFDPEKNSYVLNTLVDYPHDGKILCLIFHPGGDSAPPIVITTGLDKKFKLWQVEETVGSKRIKQKLVWSCSSIGSYRSMLPRKAAFSADGSVLAVAFGPFITFWDPLSNEFHGVITHIPHDQEVKNLLFRSDSPYLVTVTEDHLYVWNLLSFSIYWSYRINVQNMAGDPLTSIFVVSTNQNQSPNECRLLVFKPEIPTPQAVHIIGSSVQALGYLPKQNNSSNSIETRSSIIYMDEKFELQIIGQPLIITDEKDLNNPLIAQATDSKSFFSDIFGTTYPQTAPQSSSSSAITKSRHKALEAARSVFSGPSHVIPAVNVLFDTFMDCLMVKDKLKEDQESMEGIHVSKTLEDNPNKDKEEGTKENQEILVKMSQASINKIKIKKEDLTWAPNENFHYEADKDYSNEYDFLCEHFYSQLNVENNLKTPENPENPLTTPKKSKVTSTQNSSKKRKKTPKSDLASLTASPLSATSPSPGKRTIKKEREKV